jgi:hypothetical protein
MLECHYIIKEDEIVGFRNVNKDSQGKYTGKEFCKQVNTKIK